ncbi:MAG: hypothetical protein IPJ65_41695 [Archangiaceae bacterium]|nr:hypothetical protein [Archangiaceae bacterium]
MTFRTLLVGCVLFAAPVFADDAGFDGGDDTPDASAGNGGSEMMTQEGDEEMNGTCSLSRDCERGFACVNGLCRYIGYRQATQGCDSGGGLALLTGAALAVFLKRRANRSD